MKVSKPEHPPYLGKVFVKYPGLDFVYHMFHRPKITLNYDEHKGFTWARPKDTLRMPLIEDMDACTALHYNP